MAFYTGSTSGEVFDALYDFCDPGEDGENIRYWHSSSTNQDTTVVSENYCECIESILSYLVDVGCCIPRKNVLLLYAD